MTSRSDGLRPGLPPEGSAGTFLAEDADGRPWLLVWHPRGEWNALGYERPDWPVLKRGEQAALAIVSHALLDAVSNGRSA